jgi:hypothetical protein
LSTPAQPRECAGCGGGRRDPAPADGAEHDAAVRDSAGDPIAAHGVGDAEKRGKVKVSNEGTALVSAPVKVRRLASRDGAADAADQVLSEQTVTMRLKPGRTRIVRLRFTYPAMEPGQYRLIVQVDAAGAVGELTESNHTAPAGLVYVN